jgi:hypothetical protein
MLHKPTLKDEVNLYHIARSLGGRELFGPPIVLDKTHPYLFLVFLLSREYVLIHSFVVFRHSPSMQAIFHQYPLE